MKRMLYTLRVCYYTFMARTYGEYVHSISMDGVSWAVYDWRGVRWYIPCVLQRPI